MDDLTYIGSLVLPLIVFLILRKKGLYLKRKFGGNIFINLNTLEVIMVFKNLSFFLFMIGIYIYAIEEDINTLSSFIEDYGFFLFLGMMILINFHHFGLIFFILLFVLNIFIVLSFLDDGKSNYLDVLVLLWMVSCFSLPSFLFYFFDIIEGKSVSKICLRAFYEVEFVFLYLFWILGVLFAFFIQTEISSIFNATAGSFFYFFVICFFSSEY